MLNLIVAVDENFAIGKDNDILYHFTKDLKRFKEKTKDSIVVMGRNTFESLPKKLPNRFHIVLSSSGVVDEADYTCNNIDQVLNLAKKEEVWVIGGKQVYKSFLPFVKKIELTEIKAIKYYDVEVKFLEKELDNFRIVEEEEIRDVDTKTKEEFSLTFKTLIRKKK